MPQKKKEKKQRPSKYEQKVSIGMTFENAIKFLADKANKNVAGKLAASKK